MARRGRKRHHFFHESRRLFPLPSLWRDKLSRPFSFSLLHYSSFPIPSLFFPSLIIITFLIPFLFFVSEMRRSRPQEMSMEKENKQTKFPLFLGIFSSASGANNEIMKLVMVIIMFFERVLLSEFHKKKKPNKNKRTRVRIKNGSSIFRKEKKRSKQMTWVGECFRIPLCWQDIEKGSQKITGKKKLIETKKKAQTTFL